MDLATLSKLVTINLSLHSIPFNRLLLFLAITTAIKNDLLLMQPSDHPITTTPNILPYSAQSFCSDACGLSINTIIKCWSTFKNIVWHDTQVTSLLHPPPVIFCKHGIRHAFSKFFLIRCSANCWVLITTPAVIQTLYLPDQHCPVSSCPCTLKGMHMMCAQQWQCVLYTLSNGPLPVYSIHLSCEGIPLLQSTACPSG